MHKQYVIFKVNSRKCVARLVLQTLKHVRVGIQHNLTYCHIRFQENQFFLSALILE